MQKLQISVDGLGDSIANMTLALNDLIHTLETGDLDLDTLDAADLDVDP